MSRNAAANLGWDEVRLPAPVFEGDTLRARSTVLETRPSRSRPETGIVRVRTEGYKQDGTVVITFDRAVLVYTRAGGGRARRSGAPPPSRGAPCAGQPCGSSCQKPRSSRMWTACCALSRRWRSTAWRAASASPRRNASMISRCWEWAISAHPLISSK